MSVVRGGIELLLRLSFVAPSPEVLFQQLMNPIHQLLNDGVHP